MLPQSDESTAIHVQPAFAAAYQRTRLRANAVLLQYGHIIPIAAVLICLLISSTICIEREVQYSRAAKKANSTTTSTTSTTSTLDPANSTMAVATTATTTPTPMVDLGMESHSWLPSTN